MCPASYNGSHRKASRASRDISMRKCPCRHRGRPDGWPLSSSDAGQKAQPRLFVSGDAKSTPGEILPAGQATDTFDLSGLTYATPGWTASVDEPVGPGEAVVA